MRSRAWTADDVCREMPRAFRVLPAIPIVAPSHGLTHPLPGFEPPARVLDPTRLFTASAIALGYSSQERRLFLEWSRLSGNGASNGEIADWRRSVTLYGERLSKSKFARHRHRWCQLIAVELNLALGLGPDGPPQKICA